MQEAIVAGLVESSPSMVRVVRATQVEIETAVQALRDGELVAFPTETVYGLGANAQNPAAVRRIFEVKGRPPDHPVIVHLDSPRYLHRWVREVPDSAGRLADAFWPGPLTMVMPRAANVHDVITGGQDTIAIRVPAHPMAQQLLTAFGCCGTRMAIVSCPPVITSCTCGARGITMVSGPGQ